MAFHGGLPNLGSALAPGRGQLHHGRRASLRAVKLRPGLEALEVRRVPAFIAPIDYTVAGSPIGMKAGFRGHRTQLSTGAIDRTETGNAKRAAIRSLETIRFGLQRQRGEPNPGRDFLASERG
jgi:hypothetical protein